MAHVEQGFWCSTRFILAVVSFFGCAAMYSLRVNLSVVIVCMVNTTGLYENKSEINNSSNSEECLHSNSPNSTSGDIHENEGQFEWDKSTQGSILSAFFWGYLFTQILSGWMAQRFGAKKIVLMNVLVSILATLLTPIAARLHYTYLMALRVLMGLVQGSMIPGFIVLWTHWAPPLERSKLTSFSFAGMQIGYVIALPLAGFLCRYGFAGGWPSAFYTFGLTCLIWAVAWILLASDTPMSNRFISDKEKGYIMETLGKTLDNASPSDSILSVPWLSIFKSLPVWGCFAAHFAADWGGYLMQTCLPLFLNEVLRIDVARLGFIASIPYIASLVGMNIGAILADHMVKEKWLRAVNVRRLITMVALFSQAVFMVAAGYCQCGQEVLAIILLTLASGLASITSAGFLVTYMEIAPRYAGLIVGVGNTISCVGGILAPITMSALTPNHTRQEWLSLFYLTAAILFIGTVVYCLCAKDQVQPWAQEGVGRKWSGVNEEEETERLNTAD